MSGEHGIGLCASFRPVSDHLVSAGEYLWPSPKRPLSRIPVGDDYVGAEYGIPADSTRDAIDLTARQEGILLGPGYSAKGMAGLIGLVRRGFFKPADNVLFLQTAGPRRFLPIRSEF